MNNYVDYYNNLNNIGNIGNFTNMNNSSDNESYLGFIRGNMFDSLYVPYKSYKPYDVVPNDERSYLLFLIQMYGFAVHDLGLYLDVYPNDGDAIKLRERYAKLYSQSLKNYENKFGPTNLSSDYLGSIPWAWDSKYWPWEVSK